MADPLTVGTAGHVDHGKTSLVKALTGTDTDRLAEERRRGLTIELGFARLELPSGRSLSLVDVPGHERFVRTMVAGASGVDLFLMVVAADDGPMPQTHEHALVLSALGIEHGVIAITKSDRADPAPAAAAARELLPNCPIVPVSSRSGDGLEDLQRALESVAASVASRASGALGPPRLHIDRVFSLPGAGTVVTGTLVAGRLAVGDRITLLPGGASGRIRSLQVHGEARPEVCAGQRVAAALAGVRREATARGETLTHASAAGALVLRHRLAVALDDFAHDNLDGEPARAVSPALRTGARLVVHHGTTESPARLRMRDGRHELRLDRPLLALPGDRLVLRRMAPPETLGGAVVLPELPTPMPVSGAVAPSSPDSGGVVHRGGATPHQRGMRTKLGSSDPSRSSSSTSTEPAARREHEEAVVALIAARGSISLAELRDALGTTRREALALLNHCDTIRLTRRRADDRRVLRSGSGRVSASDDGGE